MSLTQDLGAFVSRVGAEGVPSEARQIAKTGFIDCIGTMIAGSHEPAATTVLAALSPRRVFVSAPLGDTNFKWRSVDTVAQEAWKVYRLHKAEEHLQIVHPNCGHVFPLEIREQAYRIFDKVLR